MENQRVEEFRRKGVAASLILAPLIYMLGQALQPDIDTGNAAEQLPVLVENQSQGSAAMVLCILGMVLFIPAIRGLTQLLRDRGAWLGLIGGSFGVAGAVLFACMMTAVGLVPFDIADVPAAQRDGVVPALQALIDSGQEGQGAVGAYIGIGFPLLPLGLLLLAIGLWRSRAVPHWVAAVIGVGAVGFVAGVDHWVRAADAAVLLVGMGAVGVQLLRRPATQAAAAPAAAVPSAQSA
jgi:hypothetical protein